jgi:hypothetical protein
MNYRFNPKATNGSRRLFILPVVHHAAVPVGQRLL